MNSLLFLATTPIPRDLPLPLPLPAVLLKVLLVIFFLVHIFFVNLMVGGSVLVVISEWIGFRKCRWDALSLEISKTVTVNKSLAVVMGIGPLLCINLVYTTQWYSANALTGHAWLLIVPLVITAFLLAYLHKYTWEIWSTGRRKQVHFAIGVAAALLFLSIPFIFLANINLMLFPSEWEKVRGFFSSLRIGNVFPRYLHFILASNALCGLFLAGWFGRKVASAVPGFSKPELRRVFYRLTRAATALQFIAGPILLFTLPSVGVTPLLYKIIIPSAALGGLLLWLLNRKINGADTAIHRGYGFICALFSIVVLGMGSGRHAYREAALASHQMEIRKRTEAFANELDEFVKAQPAEDLELAAQTGEQLFAACATCHAPDRRLVGPSLVEIAEIYKGNPAGIVIWAKAPGKKRPDFPQMPAFGQMSDETLQKIAEYMLSYGKK